MGNQMQHHMQRNKNRICITVFKQFASNYKFTTTHTPLQYPPAGNTALKLNSSKYRISSSKQEKSIAPVYFLHYYWHEVILFDDKAMTQQCFHMFLFISIHLFVNVSSCRDEHDISGFSPLSRKWFPIKSKHLGMFHVCRITTWRVWTH